MQSKIMMLSFSKFKALTRFEQSLFALPFVLTGALLPFMDPLFVKAVTHKLFLKWFFILPAFLSARTSSIAFNHLIDRKIDFLNPRTRGRPLPSLLVTIGQARFVAFAALGAFLFFALMINFPTFLLSLVTTFFIVIYSYMKRIHFTCHIVLGIVYFLAPLCAFFAIKGCIEPAVLLLGLVAFFAIVGNEIVYATLDYAFDKEHLLHSFPAKFGLQKSFTAAKISHLFCILSIISFGVVAHLPWIFFLSVLAAALIIYIFHSQWRSDERLFFYCTVWMGFAIFGFTLLSMLWAAL